MNNIINCSNMMNDVFNMASSSGNELPDIWKKVVSRITPYGDREIKDKTIPIGRRLASYTKVIDLKNGILLIEADHPGWIQYLNFYKKFILTGLKRELPNLKINSLAFRVKGNDFGLSNDYEKQVEKEQNKMNSMFEKQEKDLEKYNRENKKEDSKVSPEVKEKFESLMKSILTNNEN